MFHPAPNPFHTLAGVNGAIALLLGLLLTACGSGSDSASSGGSSNNSTAETVKLHIEVMSHQGIRLGGAKVSVGDTSGTSGSNGALSLEVAKSEEVVVIASKEGFVTQSMRLPSQTDGFGQILLMPVKEVFDLDSIQAPRTLSTSSLGGRLTFPADAFVTTVGELASGAANISITPWDVSDDDLNALPGNSQAQNADKERASVISAALMTVQVQNGSGEPLQLAPGVEATLQLDLHFTNFNGQDLEVGDTFPMWHFNKALGLWVEDQNALGVVVASATSPTGLAVAAQVSHFSTWCLCYNWVSAAGGGSFDIECRLAVDQTLVPCWLSIEITLPNGYRFVGAGGFSLDGIVTVSNAPSNSLIKIRGQTLPYYTGMYLIGSTTVNGPNAIVELGVPTTNHEVQCLMPDNSSVPCHLTLTDGTHQTSFYIPAQLTNIVTPWPDINSTTNIEWLVQTNNPILYNGRTVTGSGSTTTTGREGQLLFNLSLEDLEVVEINCVTSTDTPLPCLVTASVSVPSGATVTVIESVDTEGGTLLLPDSARYIEWQADSIEAIAQDGEFITFSGSATTNPLPNITLVLDVENVQAQSAKALEVRCVSGSFSTSDYCNITVFRNGGSGESEQIEVWSGVATGIYQSLTLPDGISENETLLFEAKGDDGELGITIEMYNGLTEGQQIDIELNFSIN